MRRNEGQPSSGRCPRASGRKDRHYSLVHDLATFVVNALQPATVSRVVIDEEESRIEVVVPDDQLSLAIGRRGQNVRLASQLTTSQIDILTEADASEKRQREFVERSEMFQSELDVDETLSQLLVAEGFTSLEEVAYVPVEEIASIEGLDEDIAIELQSRATEALERREAAAREERRSMGVSDELAEIRISMNRCWSLLEKPESSHSTILPIWRPTNSSSESESEPRRSASRAIEPRTRAGFWPNRHQRRAGQRDHHGSTSALVRGRGCRQGSDESEEDANADEAQ